VLAVGCGTYRFPGQPSGGTGTVSGQVVAVGCGMMPAANIMCVAPPIAKPAICAPDPSTNSGCAIPVPGIMCPQPAAPQPGPARNACGQVPVPGLELVFTKGGTTVGTTTDSNGSYSIELPVGSWAVTTKNYMQIVNGPTTVTVTAGAAIVANYTVWSRIAYLS